VKSPTIVAVITGDVIGSSGYAAADRRRVDRALRTSFRELGRRFPNALQTQLAFRVTAGDEFQCVIRDVPAVIRILTYVRGLVASAGLRPPIQFRASIGVGEISVTGSADPYEQDGPAFVRSRRGLVELSATRSPVRWTKLVTPNDDANAAADAVLSLADRLFEGWTVAQWEAVRWAVLGQTRQAVAKKLGIAHQNVTKRLTAAGWPYLEPALDFLTQLTQRTIAS
jgi:hypothetical protein